MLKLPEKYGHLKGRPLPRVTDLKPANPVGGRASGLPGDGPKQEIVREVKFVFNLPPSLNDQYVRFRKKGGGKGFALSEEAKAFEKNVKDVVGSQVYALQGFPTGDKEVLYELQVNLYFDKLENPGWFEFYGRGPNKGQRKAVSRYKKMDTDNRIKFLQDKLCQAVGIPGDEQVFRVTAAKYHSANQPRSEVTLKVVDMEEFFNE